MASLYREGQSAVQIAWATGRTDDCVRRRLRYLGVWEPQPSPVIRPAPLPDREGLIALYEGEGMSLLRIAAEFKCAVSTVQRRFKRLGIARRPPSTFTSRQPRRAP
jgi:AraC-like DNA-binding protein